MNKLNCLEFNNGLKCVEINVGRGGREYFRKYNINISSSNNKKTMSHKNNEL